MKKLILALLSLLCISHLQAQNVEGQIIAAQYGEYKVPGQSTGGFTFPSDTCQVTGGGKNFSAFATGVAVKIVDANPALTEIDTPSSVFITQCTINMATTYNHVPPYYLTSGTGGLQEAITANQQGIAGPNSIILNAEWYNLIQPRSAATVIASAQGNTNMPLVDITTTPYTWYQWGGSAYAAVSVGGGGTPCLGIAAWSSLTNYFATQFACSGGVLYTATANSTNHQPSSVSAFWTPTVFAGGTLGGGVILGGQFFSGGSLSAEGAPVPAFVSDSGNSMDYEQQQGTDIFQWGAQNDGSTQNYWSLFLNNTAGSTARPHNFTVNWASNSIGHDEWHGALDNFICWASGDSATACSVGLSLDSNGTTVDVGTSQGDHSKNLHVNNLTLDGSCTGCSASVASVFGRTGAVVSANGDYTVSQVTGAAPIASPALTGTPTAPTQTTGDSSTDIATDAFVQAAIVPLAPLASPALTGTPTSPTLAISTNNTDIANTSAVTTALASYALLASPALTGTPTVPTASAGTSTTQAASTAFVQAARSNSEPLWGTDSGTGAAYVVTTTPTLAANVAGAYVCFIPHTNSSTSAPTLAVGGLTAETIVQGATATLTGVPIQTVSPACVINDGTHWVLQNSLQIDARSFRSVQGPASVTTGCTLNASSSSQYQCTPINVAVANCGGTASAGSTLQMAPGYALACNTSISGGNLGIGWLAPAAGTVSGLNVRCTTTGVSSSSGVFTIYHTASGTIPSSRSATTVTVTYGTTAANTTVSDTTHSATYAAGDLLQVLYTTQGSETLAGCAVSFNY